MEVINLNSINNKENNKKKFNFDIDSLLKETDSRLFLISSIINIFIFLFFLISFIINIHEIKNPKYDYNLNSQEKILLEEKLNDTYPERKNIISELPYKTLKANLNIYAESAILIDALTGSILYEKNADEIIPPASMTKIVEMYVVLDAVNNGEISLDDIVPLPKDSWAINLPLDASKMFLGENQTVTLRELLLGLSICSGNDASIAVAKYVSGTMEAFVEKMNTVVKNLGLTKTHFVESSGYSELNKTTAREFAIIAKSYINRFPYALEEFHAQRKISYPQEHNLPSYLKNSPVNQTINQYNTNKLLGKLEGCDGLKTGFINESGYNIALTAKRDDMRFISITMRGPGTNTPEGNFFRVKDGTELMEFAFSSFYNFVPKTDLSFIVPLIASKNKSVRLIPAIDKKLTVPFIAYNNPKEAAKNIEIKVNIPEYLSKTINQGQEYGMIEYSLNGQILKKIPLVAEIQSPKRNLNPIKNGLLSLYLDIIDLN